MLCGIGGGVGTALLGYQKFAHVKKRVAIWLDPWSDYDNAGYQLIQSLMAIASGGVLGVGLGLGSPTTIPVYTRTSSSPSSASSSGCCSARACC